jgi:hypothetical protein
MKQIIKYFLVLIVAFIFSSCESVKPEFPKFTLAFDNEIEGFKVGDNLPSSLKTLLNYYEIDDEDSECNGKIFAPNIMFYRSDLVKSEDIGVPLTMTGRMQKSAGTLSKINLKAMFNLDLIKIPKLVIKKHEEGKLLEPEYLKNTIEVQIDEKKDGLEVLRKKIQKLLCEGASNIVIKINLEEKSPTGGVQDTEKPSEGGETTAIGPCSNPSLVELMSLRDELLQVIDTSSSMSERSVLAEQIWNKYFDSDAYVASYQHKEDKNPEVWEPGEGREYFISRIAILKSITDITIFRVEYSKDDHKITGIKLIECHNASELQ